MTCSRTLIVDTLNDDPRSYGAEQRVPLVKLAYNDECDLGVGVTQETYTGGTFRKQLKLGLVFWHLIAPLKWSNPSKTNCRDRRCTREFRWFGFPAIFAVFVTKQILDVELAHA